MRLVMLLYYMFLVYASSIVVSGNIRRHNEHFFAGFTRVSSNKKMMKSRRLMKYKKLNLKDCILKCIYEEECKSINHNKYSNSCETLNSSTLVTENLLERKNGWTFYETDPGYQNNGHYCEAVSPCPATHVCDDTYRSADPYICRCEDGFRGTNCQEYIGPGKYQEEPAGSCYLLRMKHEKISNGFYWIKTNRAVKKLFCDMKKDEGIGKSKSSVIHSCEWLRRKFPNLPSGDYWSFEKDEKEIGLKECHMIWDAVNGDWSQWTNFTECSVSYGAGTMKRTRRCDKPFPKYGGKNCSGHATEMRNCNNDEFNEEWSQWTKFTKCSVSCGGGTKKRTRTCDKQIPKHIGSDCSGNATEIRTCNNDECCEKRDIDYRGFNLDKDIPNYKSWQECSEYCRNKSECKGWAWVASSKLCYRKSKITDNPKSMTGVISGSVTCGTAIVEEYIDATNVT